MKNSNQRSKEDLLDPTAEQHFHIPSAIRNRLDQIDAKDVYVALACELLVRKGAHREDHVAIPAKYIREAYGKRVHQALIKLAEHEDPELVERKPFVAPTEQSLEWNVKNGYISAEKAQVIDDTGKGKCFKYRFAEGALNRSKWVVHTAERKNYHHHTWNAIFDENKKEWEKSSNIQATEGLLTELDGADRPHIKPLALANRRLTFSNIGDTLGRRYTTFGTMKSDLRKFFRINGDRLMELDITNSVFFHFFGALNARREGLTNKHGNWCPSRTKVMAKNLMATDEKKQKNNTLPHTHLHTHYIGIKPGADYQNEEYFNLDPVIEAASDQADHDFYQFIQSYMGESINCVIDSYENPTRNFAKIQANTWANSKDYTHYYYDENGRKVKNHKRRNFAIGLSSDLHRGQRSGKYSVEHHGILDFLFNANGDRTGCGMMREEARMMLGEVQPAVEREIGTETLAVHDALYVPESKAHRAKATMKEVYREEYGIVPQIDCE